MSNAHGMQKYIFITLEIHMAIGKTEISFESTEAFHTWKEREEESTYVNDQRSYQPKAMEGDMHGSNDTGIAM